MDRDVARRENKLAKARGEERMPYAKVMIRLYNPIVGRNTWQVVWVKSTNIFQLLTKEQWEKHLAEQKNQNTPEVTPEATPEVQG